MNSLVEVKGGGVRCGLKRMLGCRGFSLWCTGFTWQRWKEAPRRRLGFHVVARSRPISPSSGSRSRRAATQLWTPWGTWRMACSFVRRSSSPTWIATAPLSGRKRATVGKEGSFWRGRMPEVQLWFTQLLSFFFWFPVGLANTAWTDKWANVGYRLIILEEGCCVVTCS